MKVRIEFLSIKLQPVSEQLVVAKLVLNDEVADTIAWK
jgi:hypothetical protein